MKRKHPVNGYDDLMERVKKLRNKFERDLGESPNPTKEDLEFITTNKINMNVNELRDKGINQALDNAESKSPNWGATAYNFLLNYIQKHDQFMCEDVRLASIGIVPEPPHKRAWGGVFVLARKNGIIQAIGFKRVNNPKAHRTPATLWAVV